MDFSKYRDIRTNKPEERDVLASYRCMAELVDSAEKRQLVKLLLADLGVSPILQFCRKVLYACEESAYQLPRQIASDLMSGDSVDCVLKKPHRYTLEYLFYAKPEEIPDDIHWTSMPLVSLNWSECETDSSN